MKETRTTNLIVLHIIVLLWGFTGILGKEISLDAYNLVWWRVIIATLSIGIYAAWRGISLKADRKTLAALAGIGLITAAHWICFFQSIKVSKVSVALAVISTTALFVSLLAPMIRREKFYAYEVFLGLLVVGGLFLIFKFESNYALGISLSLGAAFFAALFSSLNSLMVKHHDAVLIAFWEMFFASVGISIFLWTSDAKWMESILPDPRDFVLLIFLGVVCTGLAFIVSVRVMKVLSPFTCAMAINLEPVYTILLALIIYGEQEYMSAEFYIGALIILSTIFLESWMKGKSKRIA